MMEKQQIVQNVILYCTILWGKNIVEFPSFLEQLLDFGEPYERFAAYHCFGDKAKKILSSLQQPYKDRCNCNDDLHSKQCLAIFVFTDNAEVYVSEIDTFIKQYKGIVGSIFILYPH